MDADFYLGEIRSGERWETDDTPAIMKPVFSGVSITPTTVKTKASVFIQVFVQDVLTPVE